MIRTRLGLLVILIFITSGSFCQVVFCPPGALWTACYKNSIFSQSYSNSSIIYSGDSIAGTDTLKILMHSKFYHQCNYSGQTRCLLKRRGDTLFFHSKFTSYTWQVLFNFACNIGQGWTTTYSVPGPSPIKTLTVTVDSITTIVENGFPLKRMFVSLANSYMSSDIITERYGWGFLFKYLGRTTSCDGDFFMGTLFYSDNEFGAKNFSAPYCNPNPVSMDGLDKTPGIKVFPNPFSNQLRLEDIGKTDFLSVEIVNSLGKVVYKSVLVSGTPLELSEIPAGIYILRYYFNGKHFSTKLEKEQ